MANTTYKNMAFRIGNSTAMANWSSLVNQASLQRAINLLDDSSLADSNRSVLTGLAGTTVSLSGFVNTTTDGVLGPWIATAPTTSSKIEYGADTARFYYGQALPSNVQYSGSVDNLQVFSVDFTFDGAVTRTSVSQDP